MNETTRQTLEDHPAFKEGRGHGSNAQTPDERITGKVTLGGTTTKTTEEVIIALLKQGRVEHTFDYDRGLDSLHSLSSLDKEPQFIQPLQRDPFEDNRDLLQRYLDQKGLANREIKPLLSDPTRKQYNPILPKHPSINFERTTVFPNTSFPPRDDPVLILRERMVAELGRSADPLDATVEKAAYNLGYLRGVDDIVLKHGLDTGLVDVEERLASAHQVTSFNQGLSLSRPQSLTFQFSSFDVAHYRLGFMVALAKHHGVAAERDAVPYDVSSYDAFSAGRGGHFRAVREGTVTWHCIKTPEADFMHEAMYRLGLQMWLSEQGYEGVTVNDVREPEALRAFQFAVSGKTIGLYDPTDTYPRTVDLGDKHDPARIVFESAQRAYDMGKKLLGERT